MRYRLTEIGGERVTNDPEKELETKPETNQVLLENLEMYGTYSIQVAAFTIKGDGPTSFTYAGLLKFSQIIKSKVCFLRVIFN